jgi:outer membrane translocation and assembly module TamA
VLTLPTLFGREWATRLFLTASRQDFTPEAATPFVEDTAEVTAEQRFRPAGDMTVSYGYSLARTHVFEPEPSNDPFFPSLDVRTRVARLTSSYAWDTRDDPSNARAGWFHSSGLEYAPRRLGSEVRFLRYLGQQYYFRSVGARTVLASAFRIGAVRGFEQDVIPSERFYTGGATSVRGFAEDAIGGTDFLGDPIGGNGLIVLNQEVRFPIFKWIRGTGFIDAGSVFARARDLSVRDLEVGTGVGVRIDSPFALIRVDFGVPLTSRDREPGGRWYFAIGQTF